MAAGGRSVPAAVDGGSVRAAADGGSAIDVMEAMLAEHLGPVSPGVTLARRAVDRLAADPTTPIAAVAGELGVSSGQLHRVVTEVVGLSPAAVRRILRMRRLLEVADDPAAGSWTTLAARFGWYDQSHFTRDFRRHTGVAPGEYRRSRLAHLDAEDRTPGFVPRP